MREKDLIRSIRAGDRDAFRLLYDRHAASVYRICLRFTGDSREAEDLCQDVFVKIYTSIRTFNARSRLSTWIHRIAVNHALNHLRNTKRSRLLLPLNGDPPGQAGFDPRPGPDRVLEEKEKSAIIREAVNALPEHQRLVLILQKFEGFSGREIADMLDCTLLSVQSRLHRAKKNLAVLLQEYLDHL
ncbi:sigma-70 family RNA polymerase sigma factor [bacterium]|nr:sigma-70 family RNA polymerase sigma factor [bacterium]